MAGFDNNLSRNKTFQQILLNPGGNIRKMWIFGNFSSKTDCDTIVM